MSLSDFLIKFIFAVFPFIKESIFGKDSITEVVKNNKLATIMLLANILLFSLLIYMTSEAIERHNELNVQKLENEKVQKILKETLPADIKNTDDLLSIARRIASIERDRNYYRSRLNDALIEIENLNTEIEKCGFIEKPAPRPTIKPKQSIDDETLNRLKGLQE